MKIKQLTNLIGIVVLGLLVSSSFISCQEEINPSFTLTQEISVAEEGPEVENIRFLREQERLGGHTIERHVGKSDAYLRERLRRSSIRAASTYYDGNQAGQVILNAINANRSGISNWKSSGGSRYVLRYSHGRTLGKVLERGQTKTSSSSRITVVLQKRSSAPNGYYVLTSYPY